MVELSSCHLLVRIFCLSQYVILITLASISNAGGVAYPLAIENAVRSELEFSARE